MEMGRGNCQQGQRRLSGMVKPINYISGLHGLNQVKCTEAVNLKVLYLGALRGKINLLEGQIRSAGSPNSLDHRLVAKV